MGAAPAGMFVPVPPLSATRLPVPPAPFIGRERQVAEVCALLGRPSVRLVTLAGPGGIGKTRLALAVAGALRSDFEDGVCFISLAPLTDPNLVFPAIAQALGIHETGTPSEQPLHLDRLQALIGEREFLLVLDNFEQVIDASPDLAALISACPRLKLLVTSREVLRLSAEQSYYVPPLSLPDLHHLPPLEFLARVEAVRLFVTRAQAAQPGFALTKENAVPVATICHRLDGLPLAIELASARIRLLPPVEMLPRLERRLPWLTGGSRDAPARHQTLRAAISWSYDLLAPDEQRLFRQLAVFVGGCTLEAIAAVCEPGSKEAAPEESLLQALATLVDKSLLRQESGVAEQSRLYMLETIREYALEQLAASGEAEDVRRSHAMYYVDLSEEAETKLLGPDQSPWLQRLEQEHDNLRAALAWALDTETPEIAARLAAALWWFWLRRGHVSEGRRWLEAVLTERYSLPVPLRARALNGAGRLALRQGPTEYASAQAMLEESLALWHEAGDSLGEMQALNGLGLVAMYQNAMSRAQSHFEQSLATARRLEDRQGIVTALNNLGLSLRYQGEFEKAISTFEECLALARAMNYTYAISATLHNLGHIMHNSGDDARAHAFLVESLQLARQLGGNPSIAECLHDLAGVWVSQGQPERGARLFGASQMLRDNMHTIMYPAQHVPYERDVALGLSQIDKAAWDAAWAQGRAMSIDDACALAMQELPAPTVPGRPLVSTYDLTERELEVLHLLVAGLTYTQIANQLTVSFHTVHAHLRSIYGKLGVTSRNQATRFAIEHDLT